VVTWGVSMPTLPGVRHRPISSLLYIDFC